MRIMRRPEIPVQHDTDRRRSAGGGAVSAGRAIFEVTATCGYCGAEYVGRIQRKRRVRAAVRKFRRWADDHDHVCVSIVRCADQDESGGQR